MEKDLRDAYAALKLLRADLVKTRRDKRALEAALAHGPSAVQTREAQQMQQEDANCQLLRLAAKYEARLSEMESNLFSNNCQKKEQSPETEDNQQEEEQADDGVEKLALLSKLHSLTITVEQQTQTMVVQQAAFAMQRGDLETKLEIAQRQLQAEKTQKTDAVLDQQTVKEKYAFLETQVEILKEEKQQLQNKLAAHAQTSSILKQQLEEKEEERVELQQKCGLLESELSREREKGIRGHEEAQELNVGALRDLESSCKELQDQLESSEAERAAEARNYEEKLAEVSEQYDSKLQELETELEDVKGQLAASEGIRAAEAVQVEKKLMEAIEQLKDQQASREQYAMTVRTLENELAGVQTQLVASEAKLNEQTKIHEEQLACAFQKLVEQQNDQERQATVRQGLESNLKQLQEQLADSEAARLSRVEKLEATLVEASKLAAQHDELARVLAMENEALQQEAHKAHQTSKLTSEELLSCQSLMEQQTQGYLRAIAQAQEQCESLESQLLAAEDHKESLRETLLVDGSISLKAFHGLSDNEVAALSATESWALLRSGISEMNGFLAQLQTLLGVVHDSLTLCGSHADILPSLCERLEGKGIDEQGQRSILEAALHFLRFAGVLKYRTDQEDDAVTQKAAQSFHQRILDALAQWYEYDAGDSKHGGDDEMPTPTFTITSRETALILQNWTRDRKKQLGVRRWLARMEAYPGVPPLRGASSNRVLELPPEGCTLELEDMTPEVKDAFRLLLIPILKQNRALYVRVFTRYTGGREVKGADTESDKHADKVWAMRIHVQSAITVPRAWPAQLNLTSPQCLSSPLSPTSPASSVSSSTSSSASSRLQIIQERLQHLHNNA